MTQILKGIFLLILMGLMLLADTGLAATVESRVEPNAAASAQRQAPTVLITGANRGIGLALATKFQEQGYQVIATARKPAEAHELKKLGVQIEALDITDKNSVNSLALKLQGVTIDMLINNAGIGGYSTPHFADLDIDRLTTVLNVNALGALRVTQSVLPLMAASERKIIANVSSRMGSIGDNNRGGAIGYRASKSALNSLTKSLSIEYIDQGFVFVVLHPGWVKTDMTSDNATYTPQESAAGLFKVIDALKKSDNGRFYDLHGNLLPW